jgi:chromate reductase, NAD(P)H dehydrogenase (quinone)
VTSSLLAVSGSLRAGSANTGLVRMAERLAPAGLSVTVREGIDLLPFYNADLDTPATLSEVCATWRDDVGAADALFLAVPEYNWGPSGVIKNAIDWLTRPAGEYAIRGKVIAIVTSAGRSGGSHVQSPLVEILGLLGNTMVTEPAIMVAMGAERIASDGTTTDPEIEALVRARLDGIVEALNQQS